MNNVANNKTYLCSSLFLGCSIKNCDLKYTNGMANCQIAWFWIEHDIASYCMQDSFARATHSAKRARDERVSCIQRIVLFCVIQIQPINKGLAYQRFALKRCTLQLGICLSLINPSELAEASCLLQWVGYQLKSGITSRMINVMSTYLLTFEQCHAYGKEAPQLLLSNVAT